jgi:hypothetical protein
MIHFLTFKSYFFRQGAYFIKPFYGCNLRMFVISWSVLLFEPFQPSLMFASKAGPNPLGLAPGLTIGKSWKSLPGTNTQAYWAPKKFYNIGPRMCWREATFSYLVLWNKCDLVSLSAQLTVFQLFLFCLIFEETRNLNTPLSVCLFFPFLLLYLHLFPLLSVFLVLIL